MVRRSRRQIRGVPVGRCRRGDPARVGGVAVSTPRVRLYLSDAASEFDVAVREIVARGPSGPAAETSRGSRIVRARRAVWQRLIDDGFSQVQVARWFGRHPSTVCVQVEPRRRVA